MTNEQQQYGAQHMQIGSTKKKECKITWAYGQKTSLKSPSNFERGARLTEVPSKSEGQSTMVHPDHYKKAALLQMGCL